jgi:hypothetical protein
LTEQAKKNGESARSLFDNLIEPDATPELSHRRD